MRRKKRKIKKHPLFFEPKKFYRYYFPEHVPTFASTKKGMKVIKSMLSKSKAKNALEVGAGARKTIEKLPGKKVFLDISENMLKSRSLSDEQKMFGDIQHLPFKSKSFGIAVANEVITHINPEKRKFAVRELARVADEIIITERYGAELEGLELPRGGAYWAVDPDIITKQLNKLGFQVKIKKRKISAWEVAPESILRKSKELGLNCEVEEQILSQKDKDKAHIIKEVIKKTEYPLNARYFVIYAKRKKKSR